MQGAGGASFDWSRPSWFRLWMMWDVGCGRLRLGAGGSPRSQLAARSYPTVVHTIIRSYGSQP
eukprot:scaffold61488_cov64-Cyclotella_meneghiniana.AAC.1